jgi:hypothetical protein
MKRHALVLALIAVVAAAAARAGEYRATAGDRAVAAAQDDEAVRRLLQQVEQAVRAGDPAAYLAFVTDGADRQRATEFAASEIRPGANRVALKERSRTPAAEAPPGTAYRLLLDVFVEYAGHARIATWRLDVRRTASGWAIGSQGRLSAVDNLYRLALNSTQQFAAHDFTIRAEDLDLTLADGSVFTADTDRGVTALVLLGRGLMRFHPAPPIEKGQIKLFAGAETLESPFEAAFIRVGELATHADLSHLTVRPVDAKELRKAEDVLREESPKTFTIDTGDLAAGNWTTMPAASDVVAEIRTRRFGTLTYSRSAESDEDISLFDRAKQKNISVYSSAARLAERGPFNDEDAQAAYDVLDYDIELSFAPDQRWFDSRARMRLKIRAASARQLMLRLADTLAVESVTSDEFGALFSVRVRNQNTLVVNLPVALEKDEQTTLTIEYSGRVAGQPGEWETLPLSQREIELLQGPGGAGPQAPRPDPIYIYGSRSYWYPRAPISDYATATLRIWVPAEFDCIASGQPTPDSPTLDDINPVRRRKLFVFNAARPLRSLSFLVTHLVPIERATVALNDDEAGPFRGPAMGGAVYNTLDLTVLAHQRVAAKAHTLASDAADIAQFYRSIVGDTPYSGLTLALVEGNTAAGHSPGYVAMIRRQSESSPRSGRSDPAAVDAYPEFQLAHQISHQWWGQAVGWKTYHDQWLSEAFAQYFAALYVGHHRGDDAFGSVMRQMRSWGIEEAAQGPLFLGYRLGHVRDDDRVFRALIYNKGAAVLHMLRRLIGDQAFFLGVRRFYANWRFEKAGTDDLRLAMEAEAGRSLDRFFERWVYGSSLPQLKFSYRLNDGPGGQDREIVLRIDQTGDLFDVPVAVQLLYADRPPVQVIVAVGDRTTELRVPLAGTFRRADINRDDGALAEVQRN